MRWVRDGFCALLVLVAVQACSSRLVRQTGAGVDGSAVGADAVTSGDLAKLLDAGVDRMGFVSRMAAIFCEALGPCCSKLGLDNRGAACEQEMTIAFGWAFPAIDSAQAAFDPQAAAACLQATAAYVSRCTGPSFWGQRWDGKMDSSLGVCESVLEGTSQLGQPCGSWQDCVTSSDPVLCEWEDLAFPNRTICKPMPPPPVVPPLTYARIGEPCRSSSTLESCNDPCEPGSYCDNGTCAPERASGPCVDLCRRSCSAASYCDPAQRLCLPRPALPDGDRCATPDQCGNPFPACFEVCGPALLHACRF